MFHALSGVAVLTDVALLIPDVALLVSVLVFVAGLVISLRTRARHGRRSTFATIAFCIFIVGGLTTAVWSFVGMYLLQDAAGPAMFSVVRGLVHGVTMLLNLAGWAFMLLALFKADEAGRAPETAQPGGGYRTPSPSPQSPSPQPPVPGQRPAGH